MNICPQEGLRLWLVLTVCHVQLKTVDLWRNITTVTTEAQTDIARKKGRIGGWEGRMNWRMMKRGREVGSKEGGREGEKGY